MFTQSPKRISAKYVEELGEKALWYGDVYEEQDLNKLLIEGIDESIKQWMRGNWTTQKIARLQNLEFHATSLLQLQGEQHNTPTIIQFSIEIQSQSPNWQSWEPKVKVITSSNTGTVPDGR